MKKIDLKELIREIILEDRDEMRVRDIIRKAEGKKNKDNEMAMLAHRMAKLIKVPSKARNRGLWAQRLLGKDHMVTKIFNDRYDTLTEVVLKEHEVPSGIAGIFELTIEDIEKKLSWIGSDFSQYQNTDNVKYIDSGIQDARKVGLLCKDLEKQLTQLKRDHNTFEKRAKRK